MNTVVLNVEPLTKKAFAPYGDVIEIDGADHFGINVDTVERYHDLAKIEIDYSEGGRPVVSLAKVKTASSFPMTFNLVERHLKGSQAFIPMFDTPVLVVVASRGESVSAKDFKAFITNGEQGFNYHSGIWHMPIMSVQSEHMFVVIDRSGHGSNCDEFTFINEEIKVKLQ
ncbi:ureidoglycolate lyase [Cognaticolwellia beringensis]|uniref:Ureidoglycolate lyase n=1 Tax=Cognaticolwellia beringensis TaxID=1967665 RepID=A0A222GDA2_9GAMM|nr:ureidoglycolate lyase [Cognaticolwellia beringensis]ASP49354.1 hypothetical protein B5D82_17200 [Cognaticolwellia beringensis]